MGEKSDEERFILLYIPGQKRYAYDSIRHLLSVQERGQGKSIIHYQENDTSQIVTSAGYVLEFQYEDRRIIKIKTTGRELRYKCEAGNQK